MNIIHNLLYTPHDYGALIARITLGLVMVPHGLQKTVGWFGGHGFTGTMQFFTDSMGIPWIFALAAILAEGVGSWALLVGGLGRIAAAAIATNMIVAVALQHWQHGFFMNWYGQQAGEGFEYHLLAIGLTAIVLVRGSGAWSVDRLLVNKSVSPP